jgi:hypothetical protein
MEAALREGYMRYTDVLPRLLLGGRSIMEES